MPEGVSYHAAMRQGGFRNIGGLAQRLTSVVAKGRGTSIARLRVDWPGIAGPELARTTRPEALLASRKGPPGGKVLRLRVSGAAALEVQHMSGQLIERVNAYFGHRAIEDIRLVQGVISQPPLRPTIPKPDPVTVAEVEARVATVKDPELRAALARLGARVAMTRRGLLLSVLGAAALSRDLRAQASPDTFPQALKVQPHDHVLGHRDAPLVIIQYASLTCSHCAHFHLEVLPGLRLRWIDAGHACFVYRYFPFDAVATQAANLLECAGAEKFFDNVDALSRTQDVWTRADDPPAAAAEALAANGFTADAAEVCRRNGPVLDRVIEDVVGGQALGVRFTPTLFINGENVGSPNNWVVIDEMLLRMRK